MGTIDTMALAAALDALDTEGVQAVDRATLRHAEKTRSIADQVKLEAQRQEDSTKDRPIMSPANWIESEYHAGPFVRSVYDVLKSDFCEICDNNIHEILMLGSIGWGKSFFARLLHLRSLYVMSRFANPHRAYRPMIETTPIVYLNLNTTGPKAKRAYFTEFRQTVLATPYFQDEFAPQKGVINELRFPKHLICSFTGASKTAAESENLIFVVLDEINLYDDVEKSRRSDVGDKYDEAVEVHSAAQGRQRSRFMLPDGTMPEPCYLISLCKETYPDSFMRRRMKKIIEDKSDIDVTMEDGTVRKRSAKILEYPEWGTKPSDFYEKKWFWITTGTAEKEPKILESAPRASDARKMIRLLKEDGAEPEDIPKLIKVPLAGGKYLNDARDNIDDFIRDAVGLPTDSISQFFKRRKLLVEARRLPGQPMPWLSESKRLTDDDRLSQAVCEHPYSDEQTDFRDNVVLVKERLARPTTVTSPAGGEYVRWTPLIAPHAPRFVHVDMGLSNDSAGIAVTCPAGWKVIRSIDKEKNEVVESIEPVVWLDLALRVNPPIDGQIQFSDIRQIVKDMMRLGFRFVHASGDGFQSQNLLQDFKEMGMDTDLLSVDATPDPYNNLRDMYHRGLFSPYKHEWFEGEMRTLERKSVRVHTKGATRVYEAIDHPPRKCFVGETRIPLLDGTFALMSELAGREAWVYSVTPDGVLKPGKARGRMTGVATEFVDVILDSGAVSRCTPEHLWMTQDGSYKEAQHIRPGIDRLMPIRQQWPVSGGYERIRGKVGDVILTHRMVMNAVWGDVSILKDWIVHHKNGDKIDNRPENLEAVRKSEHAFEHTTKRHRDDPEWIKKLHAGAKKFNESEHGRKVHSDALKRTLSKITTDDYKKRARKRSTFRNDIGIKEVVQVLKDPEATNANAAARILGCGRNVIIRVLKSAGYKTWDELVKKKGGNNHKVRAIVRVTLDEPVPVYDLEVDDYHNFALACGVFVHNSKDVADAVAGSSWNCWRLAKEHGIAPPAPSPVSKVRRDKDREYHQKKLSEREDLKAGRLEKLFERSRDDEY